MKKIPFLVFTLFALCFAACKKDPVIEEDPSPFTDSIIMRTSGYSFALNDHTVVTFKCFGKRGNRVNSELKEDVTFYVNGEPITGNSFHPKTLGTFEVTAKYKDLTAPTRKFETLVARNKKLLLELFTSGNCPICPLSGYCVDSLNENDPKIISYSIHGSDALQTEATEQVKNLLSISSRPIVKVNRSHRYAYNLRIDVNPLLDSIDYQLSIQPIVEMAINSSINQQEAMIEVQAKFYESPNTETYLTVLLVEDDMILQNQLNFFSNNSHYHSNPYFDEPDPIPFYKTNNVLREMITDVAGDAVSLPAEFNAQVSSVGSYQIDLTTSLNRENAYLIAFLHQRGEDFKVSAILNSQICRLGESVDFSE